MPIVKGKFPSDKDRARFKEESRYYKLYKCEVYDKDEQKGVFRLKELFANDKDKKEILTIAMNLPSIVVDVTVAFLFGEKVDVKVESGEDSVWQKRVDRIWKDNDLDETLKQSGASFEFAGHTQFMVRAIPRENKVKDAPEMQAVIDEVAFDNWLPDFSGVVQGGKPTTVYIISYISKEIEGKLQPERYLYVQEFSMQQQEGQEKKTAVIKHTLWREQDGKAQEQVNFNRLPGLAEAIGEPIKKNENGEEISNEEIVQNTGLNELPVFQIDTKKTVKDRFGKSIYKPAMPIFEEVNDRTTQISLQFWKHLDPIMQLPKSAVPVNKKGKALKRKLDIILTEEGMPDAKYVVNENPMIKEAMDFLKSLIHSAAKETYTPPDLMFESEKGKAVESDETLKTRWLMPLKKYKDYQGTWKKALERALKLALKFEYPNEQEKIDELEFSFNFDIGLPEDMLKKAQYLSSAVQSGLMSMETAVGMLLGLEGDQLKEEMERIRQDQKLLPIFAGVGEKGAESEEGEEGEEE